MNERQLSLWAGSGDDSLQAVDKGSSEVSEPLGWKQGTGEGCDNILVTVSVKQTGFYGSQSQFTVDVHPDSNLLKALDKDGARGEAVAQSVLDWLSAAVQFTIVPLVSGIPDPGSSASARSDKR